MLVMISVNDFICRLQPTIKRKWPTFRQIITISYAPCADHGRLHLKSKRHLVFVSPSTDFHGPKVYARTEYTFTIKKYLIFSSVVSIKSKVARRRDKP